MKKQDSVLIATKLPKKTLTLAKIKNTINCFFKKKIINALKPVKTQKKVT